VRREFSSALEKIAATDDKIIFLTGDLGFMALENLRLAIGKRFVNVGVCEQNMITMAAGLASEGFVPVCYSIAPFAVFRPAEQIRLDVCLHNMNVKIVGNGGGYGYGIMGATHHAIEDIAVLSSFQKMKCHVPLCNEDVAGAVSWLFSRTGPAYLRLGFGTMPQGQVLPPFTQTRHLMQGDGVTVVGMGPVSLNVFDALKLMQRSDPERIIDLFVVSELPLEELSPELLESVRRTGKIMVVEEHVKRGGLAENLSLLLLEQGIACRLVHVCAKGYPGGLFGSQQYHQKLSGLDAASLAERIGGFLRE
jgi:transketolase